MNLRSKRSPHFSSRELKMKILNNYALLLSRFRGKSVEEMSIFNGGS